MDAGQAAKLRSAHSGGTNTMIWVLLLVDLEASKPAAIDREQLSSGAGAGNHALRTAHCNNTVSCQHAQYYQLNVNGAEHT